jgi:hypothetical protein
MRGLKPSIGHLKAYMPKLLKGLEAPLVTKVKTPIVPCFAQSYKSAALDSWLYRI